MILQGCRGIAAKAEAFLPHLRHPNFCVQGIIQHATINNLAFGRNVEETLRILQAIQYVQENPDEVPLCFCAIRLRAALLDPLPLILFFPGGCMFPRPTAHQLALNG